MASLAASPSVLDAPVGGLNLKKRARVRSSNDAAAYADMEYELQPRMKRYRSGAIAGEAGMEDAASTQDLPQYTQRQVEYWEQVKQAELARIRAEFEQIVMKKDAEMQRCQQEIARLSEHTQAQEQERQRLLGENKLLKRAVAIQNQQKEECAQENQRFRALAVEAAEHIKRLEQTNYALRVHLQTSTQSSLGAHAAHHPDVF